MELAKAGVLLSPLLYTTLITFRVYLRNARDLVRKCLTVKLQLPLVSRARFVYSRFKTLSKVGR